MQVASIRQDRARHVQPFRPALGAWLSGSLASAVSDSCWKGPDVNLLGPGIRERGGGRAIVNAADTDICFSTTLTLLPMPVITFLRSSHVPPLLHTQLPYRALASAWLLQCCLPSPVTV